MVWLKKVLNSPVEESRISFVLLLCVVAMSIMSVAIVWQAEVISSQREAIHWLEHIKLGI
jgi:hypothetical protein